MITSQINGLKVSLCNLYAPNNSVDHWLRFLQELNCCLIDKADITTLIVRGDWNCALTRKGGGAPWKPTTYCNSLLITMDIFDLMDIQRIRHPNAKKFSYVSKALKMRSRIEFFLISKKIEKLCKKGRHTTLYRTGSHLIYLLLAWTKENPRGPGLWKFNNSLLTEKYSAKIRELYPTFREKLSYVEDKRLFWEMLKMEIRNVTISFAEGEASLVRKHEREIKERLDKLDKKICNSADLNNVDQELNEYDELKKELKLIYEVKSKATIFRAKCYWVENAEKATKHFFNLEKKKNAFTVEFHKHFFDLVGYDLFEGLNAAYDIGQLSISQRRGVITLKETKRDGH